MSLFGWLRSRVKAAILAGVHDAIDALDKHDAPALDDGEEVLRLRLLAPAALPDADTEAPARKKAR
jgi:hypothetical protein